MPDEPEIPSQPDPSPPASDPPPPPTPEPSAAPPAVTEEGQPAQESQDDAGTASAADDGRPETERVQLTPETLKAIVELHREDLLKELEPDIDREKQAAIAQATQQRPGDVTIDDEWQTLSQQYEAVTKAYEQEAGAAADLLKRFQSGDYSITPEQIAQATSTALTRSGQRAQIAEQRAQREAFIAIDDIANMTLGAHADLVVGKGEKGEDLTVEALYGGALASFRRLQNAGANLLAEAQRSGQPIPQEQIEQIVRARQAALPTLLRNVIAIAQATGEQLGSKRTQTKAQREAAAMAQLAADNKVKELAAKGQLNGSTPASPNGKSDNRTSAEILLDPSTPLSTIREIRQRQRAGAGA